MKTRRIFAAAIAVLMLACGACGGQQPQPTPPPTTTTKPKAKTPQGPTASGTTATDGTTLPDNVQWLTGLPDPRHVDRASSKAVAEAYESTLHTWDTTVDRDSRAGYIRAAVYGDQALRDTEQSQADQPMRGDAIFVNARPHRSYATTSISHSGSDGESPHADEASITVAWHQSITSRDQTGTEQHDGIDYVQLKQNGGRWYVTGATGDPEATQ